MLEGLIMKNEFSPKPNEKESLSRARKTQILVEPKVEHRETKLEFSIRELCDTTQTKKRFKTSYIKQLEQLENLEFDLEILLYRERQGEKITAEKFETKKQEINTIRQNIKEKQYQDVIQDMDEQKASIVKNLFSNSKLEEEAQNFIVNQLEHCRSREDYVKLSETYTKRLVVEGLRVSAEEDAKQKSQEKFSKKLEGAKKILKRLEAIDKVFILCHSLHTLDNKISDQIHKMKAFDGPYGQMQEKREQLLRGIKNEVENKFNIQTRVFSDGNERNYRFNRSLSDSIHVYNTQKYIAILEYYEEYLQNVLSAIGPDTPIKTIENYQQFVPEREDNFAQKIRIMDDKVDIYIDKSALDSYQNLLQANTQTHSRDKDNKLAKENITNIKEEIKDEAKMLVQERMDEIDEWWPQVELGLFEKQHPKLESIKKRREELENQKIFAKRLESKIGGVDKYGVFDKQMKADYGILNAIYNDRQNRFLKSRYKGKDQTEIDKEYVDFKNHISNFIGQDIKYLIKHPIEHLVELVESYYFSRREKSSYENDKIKVDIEDGKCNLEPVSINERFGDIDKKIKGLKQCIETVDSILSQLEKEKQHWTKIFAQNKIKTQIRYLQNLRKIYDDILPKLERELSLNNIQLRSNYRRLREDVNKFLEGAKLELEITGEETTQEFLSELQLEIKKIEIRKMPVSDREILKEYIKLDDARNEQNKKIKR